MRSFVLAILAASLSLATTVHAATPIRGKNVRMDMDTVVWAISHKEVTWQKKKSEPANANDKASITAFRAPGAVAEVNIEAKRTKDGENIFTIVVIRFYPETAKQRLAAVYVLKDGSCYKLFNLEHANCSVMEQQDWKTIHAKVFNFSKAGGAVL